MLGIEHPYTNRGRCNLAGLLLAEDCPNEALALGEVALAGHGKALGHDHPWTKDSARTAADALDALGRASEAAEFRERYKIERGGRRLE